MQLIKTGDKVSFLYKGTNDSKQKRRHAMVETVRNSQLLCKLVEPERQAGQFRSFRLDRIDLSSL